MGHNKHWPALLPNTPSLVEPPASRRPDTTLTHSLKQSWSICSVIRGWVYKIKQCNHSLYLYRTHAIRKTKGHMGAPSCLTGGPGLSERRPPGWMGIVQTWGGEREEGNSCRLCAFLCRAYIGHGSPSSWSCLLETGKQVSKSVTTGQWKLP